jgi:predicted transcriptional regulator
MPDDVIVSARIPDELRSELERLSDESHQSLEWHVARALEAYVERESWLRGAIAEGIRSAEEDGTISHVEIERWTESWGSAKRLPMPKPTKRGG